MKRNIITKLELARLVVCSSGNITQHIKRGNIIEENKRIDTENDINRKWIDKQILKKKTKDAVSEIQEDKEHAEKIAELMLRKEEAKTTKAELEVMKEINQLIDKKIVDSFAMSIAKNVRELILPLGVRLAPILGGIFGNTDPEKIALARIEIEKECSRAVNTIIQTTEMEICNGEEENE